MALFNEFQSFVTAMAEGTHAGALNASTDTLKVYLTNNTPSAANHSLLSDLPGITEQNGYTTSDAVNLSGTSAGVINVSASDLTWMASGGDFGPYRYVVLYNSTATNSPLIGWWDNGSSVSTTDGTSFKANFSSPMFSVSYVSSVVVGAPIWLTQPDPPDATEGDSYNYDVSSLVSNNPDAWSLVGSWPSGLSISSGGVITGTPASIGDHTFLQIQASNDNGDTLNGESLMITISSLLSAPQIVTQPTNITVIV